MHVHVFTHHNSLKSFSTNEDFKMPHRTFLNLMNSYLLVTWFMTHLLKIFTGVYYHITLKFKCDTPFMKLLLSPKKKIRTFFFSQCTSPSCLY